MEDRDNPVLREVLDKAAELPPAQRAGFLDGACAGDQKLRAEVEVLLVSLDQAEGFLANPTFKPDGAAPAGAPTADAAAGERAGSRVGRYKLLQLIGEGGFGTVFMAEQERPVRRRVALKIIKPGMDSAAVVARFEAERQALAMMEHPNIARVYDAGTTDAGRPYFVMELVQGIPITRYCDSKRLTPRQRMELFIPVCRAIQHAHQKGIIHRDLKPSNVLVTTCDAQPVPKVIDFGVAKALHQRLTERTLFTQFGHAVGTPEYMSPEQADMDVLGADTRSDVYSLGVLLYELLTGVTPLDGKTLREAGYARMLQLIREEEPPRPSTRLASSGEALASISADRGTASSELTRQTRGDLDWIVMKCLEKDRARRYASADGLARDIERYLSDEPVEASPPSTAHKFRRFVRKHRVPLAVAAAFVAVLLAATVFSTWQAVRATRARTAAEAEKQRADEQAAVAQAVNDFLNNDVLGQATKRGRGLGIPPDPDLKVRDALDRAATRIGERFRDRPRVEARIRWTIGEAYLESGDLQKAEPQLDAALAIFRQVAGERDRDTLHCVYDVGLLRWRQGRLDEAERLWLEALAGRRAVLGERDRDTLESLNDLGALYASQMKLQQAEPMVLQALQKRCELFGERDRDTLDSMLCVADMYNGQGKYQEAEPLLAKALAVARQLFGDLNPYTLGVFEALAGTYEGEGRTEEAIALRERLVDGYRSSMGDRHPDTLAAMHNLARLYTAHFQIAKAEALQLAVVEGNRKAHEPEDQTLIGLCSLAWIYFQTEQYAKAEPYLSQAVEGLSKLHGDTDGLTNNSLTGLAELYWRQRRYDKVGPYLARLLEADRKTLGARNPKTLGLQFRLAATFEMLGQHAQAEPVLRELQAATDDPGSRLEPATGAPLIECYRQLGREADARAWMRRMRFDAWLSDQIQGKTSVLAQKPSDAGLLYERGQLLARLGSFRDAAADIGKAADLKPEDHHRWFSLMPVLLEVGEVDEYHRRRSEALRRFESGTGFVAERIAKASLISPGSDEEVSRAFALADRALSEDPTWAWFRLCKGLAEFRRGRDGEALTWLSKVPEEGPPTRKATAEFYSAMALEHIGRSAEARAALARGKLITENNLLRPGEWDLSEPFEDAIICDLAMKEAGAVVAAAGPATRPGP